MTGEHKEHKIKVVIAPDSFKGSLSARSVGEAAATGVKRAIPNAETVVIPMADGGEGSLDSLDRIVEQEIALTVRGPAGDPVHTSYAVIDFEGTPTACIECARSTGLTLIDDDARDPFLLTSYGLGEQIRHAAARGYKHIVVFLGGSATTDGGTGLLQALGYRLFDTDDRLLGIEANPLGKIARIDDRDKLSALDDCRLTLAVDVTNPFYGPEGAALVYGPQKGASPQQVAQLDHGLRQLAGLIADTYGIDLQGISGAGAAGGLGGVLAALFHAKTQPGFDIVAEVNGLQNEIDAADWVLTGEGKIDRQSTYGKVPVRVAQMAKRGKQGVQGKQGKQGKRDRPVIAIAGTVGDGIDELYEWIDGVFSIQRRPLTLAEALEAETARRQIEDTVEQLARIISFNTCHR